MKRYFKARDPLYYDEYLTAEYDVTAGEDPGSYTDDPALAGVFNDEDDWYLLSYAGDDAQQELGWQFTIEWLPEDQQLSRNGAAMLPLGLNETTL